MKYLVCTSDVDPGEQFQLDQGYGFGLDRLEDGDPLLGIDPEEFNGDPFILCIPEDEGDVGAE